MENEYYPYENLPLMYGYSDLEPYIDEKTMRLHHDKHLQTYIDKLNEALRGNPRLQRHSLEQLIRNAPRLPRNIQDEIRNNAGGVYNHRFYFDLLENPAAGSPSGKLEKEIDRYFGSYNRFKDEFKEAALSVFGSGYAWLVSDRGKLKIVTTPNQNNPIEEGLCPILNLDVWEHAYYLKHYNERAKYIEDWFNIVNWDQAEHNYLACI